MQWGGWLGLALVVAAQYFSHIPYSLCPKSEFWLNSPSLILIKTAIILMLTAFAFLWNGFLVTGWAWVRQLGAASLVIYWVHTELVYGRRLGVWKEGLNVAQTVWMAAGMIGWMPALSVARGHWPEIREFLSKRASAMLPQPD